MITHKYTSTGERPLESIKGKRIIDIGGANSFAHGFLDAVIDIREPQAAAEHKFIGNIDEPEIWLEVYRHVKKFGKWDYAICTHTLEDINNPVYAARMIEQIAHAGIIVEPSKYRELSRFSGSFRGYIHHRWIFDVRDGELIALPKINYIEDSYFDNAHEQLADKEELIVEWEGSIGLKALNDGMPYGTAELSGEDHIRQLYKQLLP
jgi:hypothetical protein